MKNKPKGQHFVPACYLREWTAILPKNHIWVFSKNGKKRRHQRPEKVFISNDIYTIEVKGKKSYVIEEKLSDIEGKYATLFREKIKKHIPISEEDRIILCAFVAAMFLRTPKYKNNIDHFHDKLIEHIESMEQAHGLEAKESEKLKSQKKEAHQVSIVQLLPEITKLLFKMNIAFLCTGHGAKFITSDSPCNLFNPDLQWQKFYCPGLAQKNVEVVLPLSPEIMLCISWSNLRGYIRWKTADIQEANRKTIGHCHKEFISHSRRKRRMWFRNYPMDFFFILRIIRHKINILLFKIKVCLKHRRYVKK